jgi:AcrR family transcriptional regulator
MPAKHPDNPPVKTRKPRQDRARLKVELMLEAAMRLIDKGGFAALTTNAVAELAGVSIGTLYQYFPNKDAILDALSDHEMAAMSQRVIAAVAEPANTTPRERVTAIVGASTSAYEERRQVQRLLIERSLAQGARRVAPLLAQLMELLTAAERPAGAIVSEPMHPADAFVLTNAFTGVIRAMILRVESGDPSDAEIEDALARLVLGFFGPATE